MPNKGCVFLLLVLALGGAMIYGYRAARHQYNRYPQFKGLRAVPDHTLDGRYLGPDITRRQQ